MGVFKGKTATGAFLSSRKHKRHRSSKAIQNQHVFSPMEKSTPRCSKTKDVLRTSKMSPIKRCTPPPKRIKRKMVSTLRKTPAKSPFKSPLSKRICSIIKKSVTPQKSKRSLTYVPYQSSNKQEDIDILTNDWPDENELERTILYPIDRLENLSGSTSDELICLLEDQEHITENTCNKPVVSERGSKTNIEQLFNEAMKKLKANNKAEKVLTFLRLIVEGKFPLNNVAFLLFTDVVQWFSLDDVRQMRYSETTLKFFWLGKKLFGSRFIRFMSGPKNETDFLTGSHTLSPSNSKINFACPSDSVLRNFHPFGCDFGEGEYKPGLIQRMIDLTASKCKKDVSYVVMFDGKKIKRGSDMDLLGFEKEPLAVKKKTFQNDLDVIESTLNALQSANKAVENGQEMERCTQDYLREILVKCSKTVSKYLMELRKLRRVKGSAMRNYKERISKDPSLAKTLEYAMDSCRTSCYQIDLCISQLLEIQMELCRTGSYLSGTLSLFASSRFVDIKQQQNVKLLPSLQETRRVLGVENIPTSYVKQRSEEWFRARKTVKVTGSTVYAAVGCDSLKSQNEHFDFVINNKEKNALTAEQEKAMRHGTDSEGHEIATLSSVIMPFLFPQMIFHEEGYYVKDGVIVSPDGSLRDTTGNKVFHGFEGKAPIGNEYVVQQHYQVPERYITQTLYEGKALSAEKGTLYLCWTEESTTVFLVPFDQTIYHYCQDIIHDTLMCEQPKRQTRLSKESKVLKECLRNHISKCEFIGEFPSVKACDNCIMPNNKNFFAFSDSIKSLLQAKTTVTDAYNLKRTYASQVVVYLLADLDRLWKPELPHAVPVMYFYRGYSLPMELARQLTEHCKTACEEKDIDVVAIASDGEFNQLMVRSKDNLPLTMYQLSKDVWKEACKLKKYQLINHFRALNNKYRSWFDENGKLCVESVDCAAVRITTSPKGWSQVSRNTISHKSNIQASSVESDFENEVDNSAKKWETQELSDTDTEIKREGAFNVQSGLKIGTFVGNYDQSDGPSNRMEDKYESGNIEDLHSTHDETLDYDFDILLDIDINQRQNYTKTTTVEIAAEILKLLRANNSKKWLNKSGDDILDFIHEDLKLFTREELVIIARFFDLKLTSPKGNKLSKEDIVAQLASFFGVDFTVFETRRKVYKAKSLKDIALESLRQKSYPKQMLNIAYAEYIWPFRKEEWRKGNRVSDIVTIKGETDDLEFEPYYTPEYVDDFRGFVYDKTHLGTNLRKFLCLDKIEGISIEAWKAVAKSRPDILHPTLIEVSPEGKILDQMKETLARTTVSIGVEETMEKIGYKNEAEFCKVVREGLYNADDTPGIQAFDRCKKRLELINWLKRDIDFGKFPPYGGYIKGLSNILYEGLRTSQEAKLYLYALAKSGSYCVRAPNTLCSESFFGSMQDMDPWGQGILSAEGVQKHISDFATITAMKMQEDRNIYIKTKRSTAYPLPKSFAETESATDKTAEQDCRKCRCREEKMIKCIVPRNHFFDTIHRARLQSGEKLYKAPQKGVFRGEQNIRSQYGYKINESRIPPSKLYCVQDTFGSMDDK